MIDFAINDLLSGWVPELKGSDYRFDVPGGRKGRVSAPHPFSIAGSRAIPKMYWRRALPMTEYVMSREKYLYAIDENERDSGPLRTSGEALPWRSPKSHQLTTSPPGRTPDSREASNLTFRALTGASAADSR